MRKVEQLTNSLLRQNITGRASSNTAVEAHPWKPWILQVKLHGNAIANYSPFGDGHGWRLELSDCGWQTVTTRSRLNALLGAFAPGYGIVQRDWAWFLLRPDGHVTPWEGQALFTPQGCVSDIEAERKREPTRLKFAFEHP